VHSTLPRYAHSNRGKGALNPELLLLQARHFLVEADKNVREYKYIFPIRVAINKSLSRLSDAVLKIQNGVTKNQGITTMFNPYKRLGADIA
jgi:hypothetical protein